MKVLIIEDEWNAYEYLSSILLKIDSSIEIMDNIDSVQAAVTYLSERPNLDLIFLDIQLSDGQSFEIFNHVSIDTPIIFTTAYDQYALDAFRVHSIDYLLKPIHIDELERSLDKYRKHYSTGSTSTEELSNILSSISRPKKKRCLVKRGGHYEYVDVEQISYVYSEDSMTFLSTADQRRHIYSKSVENLFKELDEAQFFQINRSQIVNINAIKEVHPYFNQRLKILLTGANDTEEFVVSRNRMSSFKQWLDQ